MIAHILVVLMARSFEHASASPSVKDLRQTNFAASDVVQLSAFEAFGELDDLADDDLLKVGPSTVASSCNSKSDDYSDVSRGNSGVNPTFKPRGMRSSTPRDVLDGKSYAFLFVEFLGFLALVAVLDHSLYWIRSCNDESHVDGTVPQKTSEVEENVTTDLWGCSELHRAIDSIVQLKQLLESGADVHARDSWDETPLHLAVRAGSVQACELLLQWGSDVNATNADDSTPLTIAARGNMLAICDLLLNCGAHAGEISDVDIPPLLSVLLAVRMLTPPASST